MVGCGSGVDTDLLVGFIDVVVVVVVVLNDVVVVCGISMGRLNLCLLFLLGLVKGVL